MIPSLGIEFESSPMTTTSQEQQQQHSVISNLPPDLISTSSSCNSTSSVIMDDDISDVSSVDAHHEYTMKQQQQDEEEKTSTPPSPRSIFSDHWKRSGSEKMTLSRTATAPPLVSTGSNKSLPTDWLTLEEEEVHQEEHELYEQSLQERESLGGLMRRRTLLFPNASTSALLKTGCLSSENRATSTSQINPRIKTKLPSCLATAHASRNNKDHHVSFAPNVSVVEFKTQSHTHNAISQGLTMTPAEKGWSKWFH